MLEEDGEMHHIMHGHCTVYSTHGPHPYNLYQPPPTTTTTTTHPLPPSPPVTSSRRPPLHLIGVGGEMDVYGHDFSALDDLLDFSDYHHADAINASATDALHHHYNITATSTANDYHFLYEPNHDAATNHHQYHHRSTDFTDALCLPSDDVAELEWLSNFVHDSFSDFPENNMIGTINYRPENTSFQSRSRTKRTRAPTNNNSWTSDKTCSSPVSSSSDAKSEAELVRRCTHCASEKTPQWRTGPLGPKTLCNACGVRYKSGRLVPEYRPAASPTFVLTQHSNSHRKVMELRRQKEMMIGQQQQSPASEYQIYGGGHHHHHNRNNYEVC